VVVRRVPRRPVGRGQAVLAHQPAHPTGSRADPTQPQARPDLAVALAVERRGLDHLPDRRDAARRRWRRRQARRVRPKQRRQRLPEPAGGDALQVEPGQERLDIPCPPQERRQHLRGEAEARAIGAIATVAQLRPAHGNPAKARLDLALRRMPVAHHPAPAMAIAKLSVRQKRLHLRFDPLLQRSPPAASAAPPTAAPRATDPPPRSPLAAASKQPYHPPWRVLPGDVDHHRGYATTPFIHPIRSWPCGRGDPGPARCRRRWRSRRRRGARRRPAPRPSR